MPLRYTADQTLAAPATATQPHHLRISGGLVDEHQTGRIKHALFSHPPPSRPRHIRAFLLRCAQAFLRNSHRHYLDLGWLENVSQRLRTSLEIGEDTLAIALFVIGRAGICIVHPMANSIVKEDRDLSSCRCNCFCLSDPRRQAAIKSSQCRLCPTDRRRGKPQQRGGTISGGPCPRRQDLTP